MTEHRTTPRASAIALTRAEAVATELRELIRRGAYAGGERLRQAELAERFGVSTTPLREALLVLAQEGLVRQDAHRGFIVFEPSREDLADIYAIRILLETMATESAVGRLTGPQLNALGEVLEDMSTATADRYIALNHAFHTEIYAASGRPRLIRLIGGLRCEAAHYVSLKLCRYDDAYRQETHHEHLRILEALRDGCAAQAARAIREHLEHNARHTAALIAAADTERGT